MQWIKSLVVTIQLLDKCWKVRKWGQDITDESVHADSDEGPDTGGEKRRGQERGGRGEETQQSLRKVGHIDQCYFYMGESSTQASWKALEEYLEELELTERSLLKKMEVSTTGYILHPRKGKASDKMCPASKCLWTKLWEQTLAENRHVRHIWETPISPGWSASSDFPMRRTFSGNTAGNGLPKKDF